MNIVLGYKADSWAKGLLSVISVKGEAEFILGLKLGYGVGMVRYHFISSTLLGTLFDEHFPHEGYVSRPYGKGISY